MKEIECLDIIKAHEAKPLTQKDLSIQANNLNLSSFKFQFLNDNQYTVNLIFNLF